MRRFRTLAGMGVGAIFAYYFDPQMGRTRRAKLASQAVSMLRETKEDAEAKLEYEKGVARGLVHRLTEPLRRRPQPDDATLEQKVRSEALGRWDSPIKSWIEVRVDEGHVTLTVPAGSDGTIDDLLGLVEDVRGVRSVSARPAV